MDINKALAPIFKKIEAASPKGSLTDAQKANLLYLTGGDSITEPGDIEGTRKVLLAQFKIWSSILSNDTNRKSSIENKPSGNRGKWFKRQVYLVNFVLNSQYSPLELFNSAITDTLLPSKRLKWKELIIEWNRTNPSDILLNGNVLKAKFYLYLKNPYVMEEILLKDIEELRLSLQDYEQARTALIKFSQETASQYKQIANRYERDFLKGEGP